MKEENENNQFDKQAGNFGLPEDYFQKSADSIKNKIEWQEEHKSFPSLSALKNINVFLIPKNYFENLGLSEMTVLSEQVFNQDSVFENLKVIPKQNSFKVPENYFSEKDLSLKQTLQVQKEAKVFSLFSKRTGYAAAALVLVILGIWLYNFYLLSAQPVDCGTIACLDKQDLVKVKSLEVLDDDQLYELVDPNTLEEKLINPGTKQNKNTNLNDDSLEEFLEDI